MRIRTKVVAASASTSKLACRTGHQWIEKLIVALGAIVALTVSSPDSATAAQSNSSQAPLYQKMMFKYANNPQAEQRIAYYPGFSFAPPQGENWIEGPRQPEPDASNYGLVHRMVFTKLVPQDEQRGPHSILANVHTMRVARQNQAVEPKELMNYRMRLTMAGDKVAKNMKIVSQRGQLTDISGYQCFRYDLTMENYGVLGFRGIPFKIDNHLIECIAPSRELVVRMQYGQMVPPNVEPIDITREGEEFLKSLQFTLGPQG
jgi:hypothetical protein